jgi:ribonuclease VapC
MVVDSSAFVAVVLEESREDEFLLKMANAPTLKISAVTLMETSMVLLSRGGQARVDAFDALIRRLRISIVPVDAHQALLARDAFARYGKGRDKAKLNFGDCFSYALAKYLGETLLFQGDDFSQTDVTVA